VRRGLNLEPDNLHLESPLEVTVLLRIIPNEVGAHVSSNEAGKAFVASKILESASQSKLSPSDLFERSPIDQSKPASAGTATRDCGSINMRNLSPEQVLVECPQCGAWPMSLAPQDNMAGFRQLSFRCTKCRRLEVYRLGVAGTLIPASP
jgi:hypothetical protein